MAKPSSSEDISQLDPEAPEIEKFDFGESVKEQQAERDKQLREAGQPTDQEVYEEHKAKIAKEGLPPLPPGMTYKDPEFRKKVKEAQDASRAAGDLTFEDLYKAKGLDPDHGRYIDYAHWYFKGAAEDTNEAIWQDNFIKNIPYLRPFGHFLEETSTGVNIPDLGSVLALPIMGGAIEARIQDQKDSLVMQTQPKDSIQYQRASERAIRRQTQNVIKGAEPPLWKPGGLWSAGHINPTITEEELHWSADKIQVENPKQAEEIRKLAATVGEFNAYLQSSLPDYEIPPIALFTNIWGRGNGGGIDIRPLKDAMRRTLIAKRKAEMGAMETPAERNIWAEKKVNLELGQIIGSHPVMKHWSIIDTDPYTSKHQIMNRPEQWTEAMPGTMFDGLARTAAESWMPIEAAIRPTNLAVSTGMLTPEAVSAESLLSWAVRLGVATSFGGAGAMFDEYPVMGPWLKLIGDMHPKLRSELERKYDIDLSKSQKPSEGLIDWTRRGSDLGDAIPEYTEAVMSHLYRGHEEKSRTVSERALGSLLNLDLPPGPVHGVMNPPGWLYESGKWGIRQGATALGDVSTSEDRARRNLESYEAFKDKHPFVAQVGIVVPSFILEPDAFMALKPLGWFGKAAKVSSRAIKIARVTKSVGVIADLKKALDEHILTKITGKMSDMTPEEAAAQREIIATMMHEGLKHPDVLEEMKPAVMTTLLGLLHVSESSAAGKLMEEEIKAMIKLKDLAEEGDEIIKVNRQLQTLLAGFHSRAGRLDIESTKAKTALKLAHKFWGPGLSKAELSSNVLKKMSRTEANKALNDLVAEANRTRAMLENLQAKHADDITEESKLAAAVIENAKLLEELQALASKGLRNGDSVAWGKVGKEVAEAVEEAVPGASKAAPEVPLEKVGKFIRYTRAANGAKVAVVKVGDPSQGPMFTKEIEVPFEDIRYDVVGALREINPDYMPSLSKAGSNWVKSIVKHVFKVEPKISEGTKFLPIDPKLPRESWGRYVGYPIQKFDAEGKPLLEKPGTIEEIFEFRGKYFAKLFNSKEKIPLKEAYTLDTLVATHATQAAHATALLTDAFASAALRGQGIKPTEAAMSKWYSDTIKELVSDVTPEELEALVRSRQIDEVLEHVDTLGRSEETDRQLKFLMQDEDGAVRPGVNLRQMLGLLGKSMYDKPLAEVVGKELLQNSFDAVKAAKAQGKIKEGEGLIDVIWDYEKREITFIDNGIGMVPETLGKAFFSPGGTMKTDLDISERSGGKGLAKMVFMFGTDWIEVATVRDGIRSEIRATSDEILTAIEEGLALPTTTTKAEAGDHGTRVTVRVPETFTGADGTEKNIGFYRPNELAFDSANSIPLMGDVEVRRWDLYSRHEVTGPLWKQERLLPDNLDPENMLAILPLGRRFSEEGGYEKVTDINFDWGKAEFWVHPEKTEYPTHHVLAAGVSQFSKNTYDSFLKLGDGPVFKHNVVLNLKPNVTAEHVHYPINNQREGFNPNIAADINALARYVTQGIEAERAKNTAEVFATATTMERVDLEDIAKPDPRSGGWFKAYEEPQAAPDITVLGIDISEGVATVTERVAGKKATRKISEEGTKADESFKADVEAESSRQYFDSLSVDITKPLFHNNTTLEIPKEMQPFFAKMGSIVQMFREEVGSSLFRASSKYEDELGMKGTYASGISLDKAYHGVHVRVPYRAFFLNPLTNTNVTPRGAARSFYHTLVHEAVHLQRSGHNEDFTVEFHRVLDELEDYEFPSRITNAFASILEENWNAFTKLRQQFDRYDTQNLAKSLEDGDSLPTKAPEGGVFGIIADTLEAGGREGGPDVGRGGVEAAGRVGGEAEPRSLDRVGEILEAVSSRRGVAPAKIPKGSKDVLYQAEEEAVPVFYSKLAKVIDDLPETEYTISSRPELIEQFYARYPTATAFDLDTKLPEEKAMGLKIQGLINILIKKGVKPSEIKATDLGEHLETALAHGYTHITKMELEAWIDTRRIGVNLIDQKGPTKKLLAEKNQARADLHKADQLRDDLKEEHLKAFKQRLLKQGGPDGWLSRTWEELSEWRIGDHFDEALEGRGPFTPEGFRYFLHDDSELWARIWPTTGYPIKRVPGVPLGPSRDKVPSFLRGLLPSEDLLWRTYKALPETGWIGVHENYLNKWRKDIFGLLGTPDSARAPDLPDPKPDLFMAYTSTLARLREDSSIIKSFIEELKHLPLFSPPGSKGEEKTMNQIFEWGSESTTPPQLQASINQLEVDGVSFVQIAGKDYEDDYWSRGPALGISGQRVGPQVLKRWEQISSDAEALVTEWSELFQTVPSRYQNYLDILSPLHQELKGTKNSAYHAAVEAHKVAGEKYKLILDQINDPTHLVSHKAPDSIEDAILLLQDKKGLGFNRNHGSHFDMEDIYGHLRVSVRVAKDGKRYLALDEVQSDWIQMGRVRGYSPEENTASLVKNAENRSKAEFEKSELVNQRRVVNRDRAYAKWEEQDGYMPLKRAVIAFKDPAAFDIEDVARSFLVALSTPRMPKDMTDVHRALDDLFEAGPKGAPFDLRGEDLIGPVRPKDYTSAAFRAEARELVEGIVSKTEERFAARGWPKLEAWLDLPNDAHIKLIESIDSEYEKLYKLYEAVDRKLDYLEANKRVIKQGPIGEQFRDMPFAKIYGNQLLKRALRYAMDEGLDGILVVPPKMPKKHSYMPPSAAHQVYEKNIPNALKKLLGLGKKGELDEIQVSGWTRGDDPPPLKDPETGKYYLDADGMSPRTGGLGLLFTDAHRAKFSKPLALFQDKKAPKAAVSFAEDGRAVIYAFEKSDVSSVLHESGHIWRRQLEKTPQGRADLESLYKWAGVKQDGVWTRKAEEKFARAFERYLREGKAPLASLHGAFAKFKLWLTEIYAKITGSSINVKINDDVRAVFDRMLTGDMTEEVLGKLKKAELQDIARANDLKVTTRMTKADLVNAILARQEARSAKYKAFMERQKTAGKAKRSNPGIVTARATLKASKEAEKSITEKLVEPRKTLKAGRKQLERVGTRHTKLTNQINIAERHQALSMLEAQSKETEDLIKATFKALGIPIKDVSKVAVKYARQLTKTGFSDNLMYATSKTLAIFEDYLELLKAKQIRTVRRDLRQHPISKGTRGSGNNTIINKKKFFDALEAYYPKTTLDEFLREEGGKGAVLEQIKKSFSEELEYSPDQMRMVRDSLFEMETLFREGRLSQRAHGIGRDILEYLRAPHGRGQIPIPFSNMLTATGVQITGAPTRFFWKWFRAFNPDISRYGSMSKELANVAKRHERGRNAALGDLDSINQKNLSGDYFGEHIKYMDTHAAMKGRYGWTNFNTWEGMSPFERARRFLMANKSRDVGKLAKAEDEEFISGLIDRIRKAFPRYGEIGSKGETILTQKDIWKLLEDPSMDYKMFLHEIGLRIGATGTPSKQFLKGVISTSTAFIDAALMKETVMGINRTVNGKLTAAEADGVIKLMSGPTAARKIDDIDALWVGFNKLGMFSGEVTLRPALLSGEGEKRLTKNLVSFTLDTTGESIVLPGHLVGIARNKSAKYTMELDKLHSPEISTGALRALQKIWTLWKAHKTSGLLLPRPKYFMNNIWGDFSQIWWNFGVLKASKLTSQNALTNIPLIGTPIQNAIMKMSDRVEGVPVLGSVMNAMFNPNVAKIFMSEDGLIKLTPDSVPEPVALIRKRLAQDGVLDAVVHEELMTASRKQGNIMFSQAEDTMAKHGKILSPKVKALLKRHLVDDVNNFAANVQQRMRVGLYLDMRSAGKNHDDAVKAVKDTLYDWTHGLSIGELNTFMSINIPFYRWFRLSLGQTFRALMEPFVMPTSEYLPKALIGQTMMGRARTQGQMLALWPRWSAELNDEDLEESEQIELFYATLIGKPWWSKPGHSYSGYRPTPRVQEGYLLNEGLQVEHITQVMSAPLTAPEILSVPMVFIAGMYGLSLAALDPTYEVNTYRVMSQIREIMDLVAGPLLEQIISEDPSTSKGTKRISPGEKAVLDFLSNIPGFSDVANVRYDDDNRLIANSYAVTLVREALPVLGNIMPDIMTGWQRSGYHTDNNFKRVWDTLWHTAGPVRDYPTDLGKKLEWDHKDLEEQFRLKIQEHQAGQAPTEAWVRPSEEGSEEDR